MDEKEEVPVRMCTPSFRTLAFRILHWNNVGNRTLVLNL